MYTGNLFTQYIAIEILKVGYIFLTNVFFKF